MAFVVEIMYTYLTHWPLRGSGVNSKIMIFEIIIQSSISGTCSEMVFWLISLNLTYEKSTLVQVIDWCHQQQAIIWANVDTDVCHHMVPHTDLTFYKKKINKYIGLWYWQKINNFIEYT